MPKKRTKEPKTPEEVFDSDSEQELEVKSHRKNSNDATPKDDVDVKRNELIRLSELDEITKSVFHLKKASCKTINRIYSEYKRKKGNKANELLTDLIISKFADMLGGLDAIESSNELCNELDKDELLKQDVFSIVEKISPYIPLLGLLSGGMTTAKHVYGHKTKPKEDDVEEA